MLCSDAEGPFRKLISAPTSITDMPADDAQGGRSNKIRLSLRISAIFKPNRRVRPFSSERPAISLAVVTPAASSNALSTATPDSGDTAISPRCPDSNKGELPESSEARQDDQSVPQTDSFGDRRRTEIRYKEAAKELTESLKLRRTNWESFEVPKFTDISEDDLIPQLRRQINTIWVTRKDTFKDRNLWSKGKNIMERAFIAMSPFAKNFLRIAKQGQAVCRLLIANVNIWIDICFESVQFALRRSPSASNSMRLTHSFMLTDGLLTERSPGRKR
jgi:hypothetical protein